MHISILQPCFIDVRRKITCPLYGVGQDSSVGDPLRARRSGYRIPLGARFSSPVQSGAGAHTASCVMGTGSFLPVKRPGRGDDHPPPSRAEVKERVELYIY